MSAGSTLDPARLDLDDVVARLGPGEPDREATHPGHHWQAAVALVLAPTDDGLAIALIERAERVGDRWSGHMALPGGKRERGDRDLADTAARETFEEVALVLPAPLGRLDDQRGRTTQGLVATFVYGLEEPEPLSAHPDEVAAADWIALTWLLDPANVAKHRVVGLPFPGITHRGRIIWGLTHTILDDFAGRLGLSLPRP
ncbi:NUDIX hydrolase [Nitriliruptor alkaliphilus]|uniref:NUDIX hydrolase n=1 Tax=Nitriliruptor alkaliphilus TaxID=427918 RepID=UPI0006973F5D|nr:CoA pyrophosphatase [Nitriliruptor alkaliphilus]